MDRPKNLPNRSQAFKRKNQNKLINCRRKKAAILIRKLPNCLEKCTRNNFQTSFPPSCDWNIHVKLRTSTAKDWLRTSTDVSCWPSFRSYQTKTNSKISLKGSRKSMTMCGDRVVRSKKQSSNGIPSCLSSSQRTWLSSIRTFLMAWSKIWTSRIRGSLSELCCSFAWCQARTETTHRRSCLNWLTGFTLLDRSPSSTTRLSRLFKNFPIQYLPKRSSLNFQTNWSAITIWSFLKNSSKDWLSLLRLPRTISNSGESWWVNTSRSTLNPKNNSFLLFSKRGQLIRSPP